MSRRQKDFAGFSLIELLVALTITLGLSAMMFQLFHQNERVLRDQTLVMEMQQTARVVGSQIADEIRMAGQGVPLFGPALEATAIILPSSGANRIDFRGGISNVETGIAGPAPIDFTAGEPRTVSVVDGSMFSSGKFVYVWTPSAWLRAEVTTAASNSLTLTPRQTGGTSTNVHFATPPAVSLEEAASIYLSGTSVRRATAADLADPANPTWSAANEIGKHFRSLAFSYYDWNGHAVSPSSLSNRLSIARVDVDLTVETAAPLSNGTRPVYAVALRTVPRNVKIRNSN